MKIGIVEIAARARVSEATVSRVLNRRHGVAARTREAVEQAMRELGYERPARGGMVAVVVPSLTDPLHAEFAERIQAELAPRGLTAAVWPAQPGTPQESALLASLAEHAVGCVVLLRGGEGRDDADLEAHASLDRRGVPTVGVNTAALPGSPVFSADDRRAAELAVEHLYALGHRTIGLAAGPGGNAATTRLTGGFLDELTRRGMPHPDRWLVTQHASVEGGQAAAGVLLALGDGHRDGGRPDGPRSDPGCPQAGPVRAVGRLGGGLRRGVGLPVRRPPADRGAPPGRPAGVRGRPHGRGPGGRAHRATRRTALRPGAGGPGDDGDAST